jgi:putative holliday junction resolvase
MMGRILGIDYGNKRTGLAVTDPLKIFASPLKTISTSDLGRFIADYVLSGEVEAFVIGYPVDMNNKPSESVKYINPFIRELKKKYPAIPVHLTDERFTSKLAFQAMIDGGLKKKKRQEKSIVDMVSASIILQSFLDSRDVKKRTQGIK